MIQIKERTTDISKQTEGQSSLISIGLVLVIAATIVAYSNVLFNFFNGDDFVHLTWLKDAVKNPELIWRNFHSSWLDGTTTRFYRPLISVFMVTDYLAWGINGLGFHITNLLFHLASTLLIFFIVKNLARNSQTWALTAAGLFGLYPLHPEAVSWITGRVDSVVTPFCLFSLLAFMYYRQSGKLFWAALATVSMWLGLFSKEMAITLPAIFVLYEVLYGQSSSSLGSSFGKLNWFIEKSKSIVVHTGWFWLMLGLYFFVRVKALGTFVGGYDDSLLYIANFNNFISSWLHGLKKLVVPLNMNLMSTRHILSITWQGSAIVSAVLGIYSIFKNKDLLRPVAFLTCWLILCLAPVYKIFNITDDLQGSRLAYLATVPLTILMTVAFARFSQGRASGLKNILKAVVAVCLLTSAAMLLWTNNQAWAEAGRQSNAIRMSLNELYKKVEGDPQALFIGLPDEVNGSYICRNALWGMTKSPQMHRDIVNCLMVNSFEPILPFGYLKESLYQAKEQVRLFRWDNTSESFLDISLPESDSLSKVTTVFQGNALKQIAKPQKISGTTYTWLPDGTLSVSSSADARKHSEIILDLGKLPCWFTDFIAVNFEVLHLPEQSAQWGADLLYKNDINKDFELRRRTHAQIYPKTVFALHSLPEWSLGGTAKQFKLMLPPGSELKIKSIEVVRPETVMPSLTFKNSGYFGTKGYLHISDKDNTQVINIDTREIANAAGARIEITRPNLLFEFQNTTEPSRVIAQTIDTGKKASVTLTEDKFPSAGIYELRVRAIDSAGNPVGLASDHIVISVD
ncbi:MAG: hypothetical protein K2Y22_04895 [Candidatus Obscuribacterales bacterium]|nr:hypothetical protein [Candidatus Obscuribacterales bacterium]